MAITPLPEAPSRSDPATFADKGDALLGALATFVSEANALLEQCQDNATTLLSLSEIRSDIYDAARLRAGMYPGAVLQVVSGSYSTTTSTSSSTFSNTGLEASITPISASSKVLVLISANGVNKHNASTVVQFRLVRGSTPITNIEGLGAYSPNTDASGNASCIFRDSPGTTSLVTYRLQFASAGNVANVSINGYSVSPGESVSFITLMEIAG
jgi:hypothetical protein